MSYYSYCVTVRSTCNLGILMIHDESPDVGFISYYACYNDGRVVKVIIEWNVDFQDQVSSGSLRQFKNLIPG